MTLSDLARHLGCRLEGDGSIEVTRVVGLEAAGPGDVTFLANPKYAAKLPQTRASAVIAGESVAGAPCAILRSSEPYLAFANAVAVLTPPLRPAPGISALASIDPTAEIGPEASIAAFVVVGPRVRVGARTVLHPHVVVAAGASIGPDCVLHAHASVREDVDIGARVILQDAAVIGSDGFGFARRPDGSHQKIPQVGRVVIEDDVEIGANSAVDRPAVGETRIGAGTKIDNLVHVAHGVALGRRVLLAAQVGIAGSTTIGDDVMMAGQSGVAGHISVGDKAIVGAKSAVLQPVEAGAFVTGSPAFRHGEWRKASIIFRHLPSMKKRLEELEQRIIELEEKLAECQTPE